MSLLARILDRWYFGQAGKWKKFKLEEVENVVNGMTGALELRAVHVGGTYAGSVLSPTIYFDVDKQEVLEKIRACWNEDMMARTCNRRGITTLVITEGLRENLLALGTASGDSIVLIDYAHKLRSKLYDWLRNFCWDFYYTPIVRDPKKLSEATLI